MNDRGVLLNISIYLVFKTSTLMLDRLSSSENVFTGNYSHLSQIYKKKQQFTITSLANIPITTAIDDCC